MTKVSTDVLRRVYPESGEHFIQVGNWPESPDSHLCLSTHGESEGYFGAFNVSMTPEFAAALGRALIAAADEMELGQRPF